MSDKRGLRPTLLRRCRLNPTNYTLSLLQEGIRVGIISSQEMGRLQTQLLSLLNDRVLDYTHGESTSVRTETAQSILSSLLYCLDAYLKQFSNPMTGLSLLQNSPLVKLYERGVSVVTSRLEHSQALYANVRASKLELPLLAYQSTIESLPAFLQSYDIAYAARETMADIDYPLAVPIDDQAQTGVFYIEAYLERLKLENDFCSRFLPVGIEHLLTDYGRVYDIDYREALVNVFEVVANNALFSVMSGGAADDLLMSQPRLQVALSLLDASCEGGLESLLVGAATSVLDSLCITDEQLRAYVTLYTTQALLPRLVDLLRVGVIDKIVIPHQGDVSHLSVAYFAGVRMTDRDFRSLVERLRASKDIEEKVQLISGRVRALEDYVDVLEAGCLHEDDFGELYRSLDEWALAALVKVTFTEELREGRLRNIIDLQLNQNGWQSELLSFLSGLSDNQLASVEGCLRMLTGDVVHRDE